MNTETNSKQQLTLYYHLILFVLVLVIVTNWLLFTLVFGINDTDGNSLVSDQHTILHYLRDNIPYSLNSDAEIPHQPCNKLQSHDLFEYSSKFNLWTVTTIKLPVIAENDGHKSKSLRSIEQTPNSNGANLLDHHQCDPTIWPSINSSDSCQQQPTLSRDNDRIVEQLIYQPQCLSANNNYHQDTILKIRPDRLDLDSNQNFFIQEACTVNKCEITYDWNEADALIFKNFRVDFIPEEYVRTEKQIWIAHTLESPSNLIREKLPAAFIFNWTATYRHDSDIVTPYEKFVPYNETIEQYQLLSNLSYIDKKRFYLGASANLKKSIRSKKKNVVWFVSNCFTVNYREKYVELLSEFIDIDVYGRCGNLTCLKANHTKCLQMANEKYRFYIAFENSNHTDYITEKLYNNGLGKNDLNHMMVPIVMGTSKSDYVKHAPKNSFIHIEDFDSPKELAKFLLKVANDEVLFHSYFVWKAMGKFIDTKFYCRVCTMLHHSRRNNIRKYYTDINRWFSDEIDMSKKGANLFYDA